MIHDRGIKAFKRYMKKLPEFNKHLEQWRRMVSR